MKILNIIGSLALGALVLTSCANHDLIADKGELGQVLPTVDWEQSSKVVKSGNYAGFKAKYYTSADRQIDHSEVWVQVKREQTASATAKLTTALAYNKSYSVTDTVRSAQSVAKYAHSKAEWDGHEFVLTDSFPTSRTLAPVVWKTPTQWDEDKFKSYYPEGFDTEFVEHMITTLTKDSAYYNDLRNVYVKYDFKKETFEALNAKYGVNFPTETESDKKSDAWYTQVKNSKGEMVDEIDHYYYITVVDEKTTYHEIATPEAAPEGVSVFPVYKSSPWLFSRYSDDTGGKITTVRAQYMPYWKDLISTIPFIDWIYDSGNKVYNVDFSRTYHLQPTYRVYDTEGKVGITSNNEEITLN